MKKEKIPILTAIILLITFSSFSQSTLKTTKQGEMVLVEHGNITFSYNSGNFGSLKVEKVKKQIISDELAGFPVEAPEHYCFHFENKNPFPAFEKGARYFQPAYSFVCVIPLTDLSEKDFSRSYPYVSEAAAKLQILLKQRSREIKQSKDYIDLPYNHAGSSFKSKIEYVNFNSGTGVLFLTQYTQESHPNPVNNEELTYNFQGLTTDGKYYIAARLGTSHSSLPKGIDFTDHIERDDDWLYLKKAAKEINNLPEDAFKPSLLDLKKLISSISVK